MCMWEKNRPCKVLPTFGIGKTPQSSLCTGYLYMVLAVIGTLDYKYIDGLTTHHHRSKSPITDRHVSCRGLAKFMELYRGTPRPREVLPTFGIGQGRARPPVLDIRTSYLQPIDTSNHCRYHVWRSGTWGRVRPSSIPKVGNASGQVSFARSRVVWMNFRNLAGPLHDKWLSAIVESVIVESL